MLRFFSAAAVATALASLIACGDLALSGTGPEESSPSPPPRDAPQLDAAVAATSDAAEDANATVDAAAHDASAAPDAGVAQDSAPLHDAPPPHPPGPPDDEKRGHGP